MQAAATEVRPIMRINKLVCADNETGREVEVTAPVFAAFRTQRMLDQDSDYRKFRKQAMRLAKDDESHAALNELAMVLNAANFIEVARYSDAEGIDRIDLPAKITLKSCADFLMRYTVNAVDYPPEDDTDVDENPSGTSAERS